RRVQGRGDIDVGGPRAGDLHPSGPGRQLAAEVAAGAVDGHVLMLGTTGDVDLAGAVDLGGELVHVDADDPDVPDAVDVHLQPVPGRQVRPDPPGTVDAEQVEARQHQVGLDGGGTHGASGQPDLQDAVVHLGRDTAHQRTVTGEAELGPVAVADVEGPGDLQDDSGEPVDLPGLAHGLTAGDDDGAGGEHDGGRGGEQGGGGGTPGPGTTALVLGH